MTAKDLIKQFEGCKLQSYKCPRGIWTIGYGLTYYPNYEPVKEGETITQEQADRYLDQTIDKFTSKVLQLTLKKLTENQRAALISFVYNVGITNFSTSTLLKKVNKDPRDPTIREEFLKWNKANGQLLQGLVSRRQLEANLYFSK